MKNYLLITASLLFILAGCTNSKAQTEPTTEHQHSETNLHIMFHASSEAKTNKETTLGTHIMNDGKMLAGANVRFEIWKKDSKKHEYIDAKEVNPGMYTADKTFSTSGTYQVKIHVENEKEHIHDHLETSITVK